MILHWKSPFRFPLHQQRRLPRVLVASRTQDRQLLRVDHIASFSSCRTKYCRKFECVPTLSERHRGCCYCVTNGSNFVQNESDVNVREVIGQRKRWIFCATNKIHTNFLGVHLYAAQCRDGIASKCFGTPFGFLFVQPDATHLEFYMDFFQRKEHNVLIEQEFGEARVSFFEVSCVESRNPLVWKSERTTYTISPHVVVNGFIRKLVSPSTFSSCRARVDEQLIVEILDVAIIPLPCKIRCHGARDELWNAQMDWIKIDATKRNSRLRDCFELIMFVFRITILPSRSLTLCETVNSRGQLIGFCSFLTVFPPQMRKQMSGCPNLSTTVVLLLVIFRARFDKGDMQVPVSIFSTGSFFPTFPLSLQTRLIPL